jgi:hypothetical protein
MIEIIKNFLSVYKRKRTKVRLTTAAISKLQS